MLDSQGVLTNLWTPPPSIIPRWYQKEAIEAVYGYFRSDTGNPLIVLPTGSGKSLVAALFGRQALEQYPKTRLLIVTHVKELIEQNLKAMHMVWPLAPTGVYSAGLKRRDDSQILFAGIQSIYKRAFEFDPFDLIIIDEAHLIPKKGDGMYLKFLDDLRINNPYAKCIGLTATPYRMTCGLLTDGPGNLFTDIAYEVTYQELVADKYLVPLISKGSDVKVNLTDVKKRNRDYIIADLEEAYKYNKVTQRALDEACYLGKDRKSWLVFACSVNHALECRDILRDNGITAECIHAKTPKQERTQIIQMFREGRIRAVTNCMVLTTGFDAPGVDMLVFLRPTESPGLFVQMAGRGSRLSPDTGKTDCLCLDYANLIENLGPVDSIRVRKKSVMKGGDSANEVKGAPCRSCPECYTFIPIQCRECSECGFLFPLPQVTHEEEASTAPILSEPEIYDIESVAYYKHEKKGKPPSLRVEYWARGYTLNNVCSEWICLEHEGFARKKAERWWYRWSGGERAPLTVDEAFDHVFKFPTPKQIKVNIGGRWPELMETIW